MKNSILVLLFSIYCLSIYSQSPSIEWAKCYGGSQGDGPGHIQKTKDHGSIGCGSAASINGNVIGNHGDNDAWIIKLDSTGNLQWQRCYGGTHSEVVHQIVQTRDGGYFFAGVTTSNDGDVSGNHSLNHADVWVVRIDSAGDILWQKCYGGTDGEVAYNMDTTFEGGCIITGVTRSDDGDVSGHHNPGTLDIWVIKIDSAGGLEWQKCLGGFGADESYSIRQTTDSGYIVGAYTQSFDGDVSANNGLFDYWLVKLSNAGAIQWQKCLGGSSTDWCYSVVQATDGGYVAVGAVGSNDGDVLWNYGGGDFWIVKVDSGGTIQWQKTYGGSLDEYANDIEKTNDGGYIVSGYTESNDSDVTGNHGNNRDCWIIKLDSMGDLQWQKCLGGFGDDYGNSIVQADDSGYVMGGAVYSNDGDVSGNHGNIDYWVVKLGSTPVSINNPVKAITDFTVYFNAPCSGLFLNFYANGNERLVVQLSDITGRILLQQPFTSTDGFNKKELQTGELSRGVYVVRLTSEGGGITKKLMVQ